MSFGHLFPLNLDRSPVDTKEVLCFPSLPTHFPEHVARIQDTAATVTATTTRNIGTELEYKHGVYWAIRCTPKELKIVKPKS